MSAVTAKSPYQRYKKTPYRYSDLYNNWRRAVREGRHDEARRLSLEHSIRHFGPKGRAPSPPPPPSSVSTRDPVRRAA